MKLLFFMTGFLALSLMKDIKAQEPYPLVSYYSGPPVRSSSDGYSYGSHGIGNTGYGAYGSSNYGDIGLYGDNTFAAEGHHGIADHRSNGEFGGLANSYGSYRNGGSYAEDKGSGFEKSYSYDKTVGHHDEIADDETHQDQQGVHGNRMYFNMGGQGFTQQDGHELQRNYGGNINGINVQDNQEYGSYESDQGLLYDEAPGIARSFVYPGLYEPSRNGYFTPVYYK